MFAPDQLAQAIRSTLNTAPDVVPTGKRAALVVAADAQGGVRAVLAERLGDHWQLGQEVEWHGGTLDAGVYIKASW